MAEAEERPDLAPDDATPRGFVRLPGIGLVHKSLFVAGGVFVAWLLYRRMKGR